MKSFFICLEEVIRSPTLCSSIPRKDCSYFSRESIHWTMSCVFYLLRGYPKQGVYSILLNLREVPLYFSYPST